MCGPAAGQSPWSVSPAPPSTGQAVVGGAGFVAGGDDGLGSCHGLKTRGHAFLGTFSFPGRCCRPPSRMAVG